MQLRVLGAADVRALLPMAECIELMRRTMIAVSQGRVVLPLRTILVMPEERGLLGNMSAYLSDPECFGVKLVSLNPRRPAEYSSHLGLVVLFEAEEGRPVAVLDAAEITAIRTAAASALATSLLARSDAGDLALLGAGEQARSHLEAMRCVRPLHRIRLWARNPKRAADFAKAASGQPGPKVEPCATVEEAVSGADLICTLTKARDPILQGDWISAGAHLNVVGSSRADAAEIDTATVVRARLFVDRRESTHNEGGEYLRAIRAGVITPEHIIAEIGEVASNLKAGRRTADEVTLYKSLGIAPQDLASAHYVFEQARRRGLGHAVDF